VKWIFVWLVCSYWQDGRSHRYPGIYAHPTTSREKVSRNLPHYGTRLKGIPRWTFIIAGKFCCSGVCNTDIFFAAICGILGVALTYFFVPDMTGVDLADEDAKFFAYLRENGWKGPEDSKMDEKEAGSKL